MAQLRVSYLIECADEVVDEVIDQLTDWYTADSINETTEGIPYTINWTSVTVGSVSE